MYYYKPLRRKRDLLSHIERRRKGERRKRDGDEASSRSPHTHTHLSFVMGKARRR